VSCMQISKHKHAVSACIQHDDLAAKAGALCIVIYSCGRVGVVPDLCRRVNEAARREWARALACLPDVDVACH
jgi:hypothetical protein